MTGAGGDAGLGEHWASMAALLGDLERSVAAAVGEGNTEGVREYLDHNEFGLALELLVCLVMRAGLPPAGYAERVDAAARRMGLDDSAPLAEWRRYTGQG